MRWCNLTYNFSLLILGCVWLVALSLSILKQCISPLLPTLIMDFRLTHSMGGLLYSLPILMIALFSYPLGILSDRIGVEIAVGCGIIMAVSSSLAQAFSPDFLFLALSRAGFGLGFAMCFPNLPKLVKENFPQRLAGTATGFYTTAIPFGTGLGIALTKPLLTITGGWREVLVSWSLMATPVIVLWWIVAWLSRKRRSRSDSLSLQDEPIQQPIQQPSHDHSLYYSPSPLLRSILIAGLIFSLLNLLFYCTIGWLPTYLTEKGWEPALAATATSLLSFIETPAVLFVPILSDRTGRRRLIMIGCFSLIAICSAAISISPSLVWAASPIWGVTFGGVFALLLALPIELVEREKVGRAAGAIISMGYFGALMGPPLAGYLRDLTGDFTLGFLLMAFIGVIGMVLSFTLPDIPRYKTRG